MQKNLTTFLILSFLIGGCASTEPTRFDGKWEFCENNKGEKRACLKEEDVKKLREVLIRCKQKTGG